LPDTGHIRPQAEKLNPGGLPTAKYHGGQAPKRLPPSLAASTSTAFRELENIAGMVNSSPLLAGSADIGCSVK
jgi:hypothetical protein